VHRTIVTSLFVRYSAAATPAGRLCNTMTRKRRRFRRRKALHIPVTVLYTPQLLLVSLRTRISLRGGRTGHRPSAQSVTGRYLNMVTNLHIAVEACWAQTEPSRASSTYQEPGYSYLESSCLANLARPLDQSTTSRIR